MSDIRKSKILRGFLWLVAVAVVAATVAGIDTIFDELPIWWISQGKSHYVMECGVFWMTVSTAIWRWLSHRVWIGSLPKETP